jgi:hypothetical protein
VPSKSVTMRYKDPSFVIPLIKSLLNKCNRLQHIGKLEAATKLAKRINGLISDYRSKQFVGLASVNSKDLWAAVKGKLNKSNYAIKYIIILLPDLNNQLFATIASDENYNLAEIVNMHILLSSDDYNLISSDSFNIKPDIEPLLRRMKNTAAGYNNVGGWVFKTCCYELAGVSAFIINYSFRTGTVPAMWLIATVTPMPKVLNPQAFSDLRLISVKPALSRLTVKLLVRCWLRPALLMLDLQDQFTFRPTGSTTCH